MKKITAFAAILLVIMMLCGCGGKTSATVSEIIFEEFEENELTDEKTSSVGSLFSSDKTSSVSEVISPSSKSENTTSSEKRKPQSSKPQSSKPAKPITSEKTGYIDGDTYISDTFSNNKVIVYKTPKEFTGISRAYSVQVCVGSKWIDIPVYFARAVKGDDVSLISFASFDLDGVASVRITPVNAYNKADVRPSSDVSKLNIDRTSISFSVDSACQLSIELDDDMMSNLQLFVNPIEKNIPSKDDSNVMYFKAGVHTAENSDYITTTKGGVPTISVPKNTTVYLEGGAIVKASIVCQSRSDNITICGRGILDIFDRNAATSDRAANEAINGGEYPCGIKILNCDNVKLEGIIIRNSCSYAVMGTGNNNVEIDNLKIFTSTFNGDGIDFMAASNVTLKNCFVRSWDDSIAVYATRWSGFGDSRNWKVSNMVLISDSAHAINIGSHGSQNPSDRDQICDITFKDIDVLDASGATGQWSGAIAFTVGDENYVHDITFEKIRIDTNRNNAPFMICSRIMSFNVNAGYKISNILFKDIKITGKFDKKSQIFGYDSGHTVDGITFENVTFGGEKLTNDNAERYFEIKKFANNIIYK